MTQTPLSLPRHASTLAAAALSLGLAHTAHAQNIPCNDVSLPNVVFIDGSSAVGPFVAKIAQALLNATPPVSVVYKSEGSCNGVNYLASVAPLFPSGTAQYWTDVSGDAGLTCDIQPTTPVDIGVSDVFATSCGYAGLPANVKDFHGPIQTMTFAVNENSTRQVISAEAAYLTFGLGDDGGTPWSDHTKFFVRDQTSGTQQMIARAIGVPAARWAAPTAGGSAAVRTALQAATAPQNTADLSIGILGLDSYGPGIRALAYQHYDQDCGYTPSSSATATDLVNTRDGHYYIWGPIHMLTKTTGSHPTNLNAKTVIDLLQGTAVSDAVDLITIEAGRGVVPECAMRVSRDTEVGPLMSYMPEQSCECKFLSVADSANLPAECTPCGGDAGTTCPADRPACNYGFCEVQ
ncbi:MAG TPA: hypothetical protein VL137_01350 [Polyangiaceae bacterium]|nr:hypothetical protein [Polyangiaceae bacterium]